MVRMVIIGPRGEHHIGVPLPDSPDNLFTHWDSWQQLAIMVVEHFIRNAEPAPGLRSLCAPPFGQRSTTFALMPGVTVGHRHELDVMSHACKQCCRPACPYVAVIRMRPKCNHPNFVARVLCQKRTREQK